MRAQIQTPATLLTHSQPLIDNANNLTEQADRALVTCAEEFASATDFVRICQGQYNSAEDARKAVVQPLNDHVKWINDQFRPITSSLMAAKKKVSDKAAAWRIDEDRRIREEAEEEQRKADEQALADAEAATEAGDEERAEAILDVAAETPPAPTRAAPIRGGITGATGSTRTTWKGEVQYEDIKAVCQGIIDDHLPTNIIKDWNKTVMNAVAKRIGEGWPEDQATGKHHGLTVNKDVGMVVR